MTPAGTIGDLPGAGALKAFIVGLAGCELGPEEARFLAAERPCGLIIFTRNYANDSQLAALIRAAKAAIDCDELFVLVDQEGGRVQRLRGEAWPDMPPAVLFGAVFRGDHAQGLAAARIAAQGLGQRLRAVGINTNCAPCLDVPVPDADAVIGDRAYGDDPTMVSALGRAVCEGLIAAGVVPVIKHVPGHGRAMVDSHKALPIVTESLEVLSESDFVPFRALADMPAAMSAHVKFAQLDAGWPASLSRIVTRDIIRGEIGFDGLLMSDDISMGALEGDVGSRAAAALAAGSDVVLHCNGDLAEMAQVAACVPRLSGAGLERFQRCLAIAGKVPVAVAEQDFDAALREVWSEAGGRGDV